MNDVWDQFVRNEESFTRLLKLDELLRLNQQVNELIEERSPIPKVPTPLLEPRARAMVLRLMYDRVRLRTCRIQGTGLLELRLTERQLETFLKEVAQSDESLELAATKAEVKLGLEVGILKAILERTAAIIGLTYAELGDDALLTDDEALERIRELLLEYDDQIITRNYQRGYDEIVRRRLRERMSDA